MKTVQLRLVGIDGNAFSIMGAFRKQARKENWTKEEIQAVLDEAMDGDYNHLIATIWKHCEEPEQDDEYEEECYFCDGEGEITVFSEEHDGDIYETCPDCNGYGVV